MLLCYKDIPFNFCPFSDCFILENNLLETYVHYPLNKFLYGNHTVEKIPFLNLNLESSTFSKMKFF